MAWGGCASLFSDSHICIEGMSLQIETAGPVVRVTLNRPEVRNAFNEELIAEITAWADALTARAAHPDDTDALAGELPRVAVLAGAGKMFCAGADLGWMSKMIDYSREENVRDARGLARMFDALDRLPIPLIGRVHGAALGGGVGMVAVCDVAVTTADAIFGFTEVKLGIIPAVISPYAIAKIGQSAARELFLTGARFTAARAQQLGLVHYVAETEADLDRAIARIVNDLLSSGPHAVSAAKALIARVATSDPDAAAEYTIEAIARQRTSPEGQEGMRAFLEKRLPGWSAGEQ